MPVGMNREGQTIYSSARDIGNIAAGYIAGVNDLGWVDTRIAFDAYQSKTNGKLSIESRSSRNAQKFGWELGYKSHTKIQRELNLIRSIYHFIR